VSKNINSEHLHYIRSQISLTFYYSIMKCLIISLFAFIVITAHAQEKYVLVIHGGAGSGVATDKKAQYQESLYNAISIGKEILASGGTALDAVEACIKFLENDSLFNAGKGGVVNERGIVECDASIMNGKDLSCGAVSSVRRVKNPISLSRAVMEKTSHVMLTSIGAEKFASEVGLELIGADYFITAKMKQAYQKKKMATGDGKGTVGAVALDIHGNLAAGTSTGGMFYKKEGRVGDSPIIGAGTYADNESCAVSCTGWGELFIKRSVAFRLSFMVKEMGLSLDEAANRIIYELLPENSGGLISIDKNGNYVMLFNTEMMHSAVTTNDTEIEVFVD
jgi:beta-aspartyl-peptidase (threonine type)